MVVSFLVAIDAFLGRHPELSATTLGARALSDPSFVSDLCRGREPRRETRRRLRAWMRDYERRHGPAQPP